MGPFALAMALLNAAGTVKNLNEGNYQGAAGNAQSLMGLDYGGRQEEKPRITTDQNMQVSGVPTPVLPEYFGPPAPTPQPGALHKLLQLYFGARALR